MSPVPGVGYRHEQDHKGPAVSQRRNVPDREGPEELMVWGQEACVGRAQRGPLANLGVEGGGEWGAREAGRDSCQEKGCKECV